MILSEQLSATLCLSQLLQRKDTILKTIAAPAPELVNFLEGLELPLNHPQQRHFCQIADGLITTQGSKTLSALYRHMVGNPCPKLAADTFREAPWQADDFRVPLREYLVKMAFELAVAINAPKRIFVSIDDSLTVKDMRCGCSERLARWRSSWAM